MTNRDFSVHSQPVWRLTTLLGPARCLPAPALMLLLVLASGCSSGGVREDRSINYAQDGESVGFQHGDEGVFVASGDGEQVEKIFDTAGSIAVSSPRFSPTDKRLIFAVAHSANPEDASLAGVRQAWDADPAGRRFQAEDIVYTCLLRPEPTGDDADEAEPEALFQAACGHAGYVAANLAVRWHPDGQRILFVDRLEDGGHSLFEFDLATRQKRRLLQNSAAALIFDVSPQGKYLVALLAGDALESEAGIWIRATDQDSWWHVAGSDQLAITPESPDLLERLRAMQPAWTHDDQRFACVVQAANGDRRRENAILTVESTSREVATAYRRARHLGGLQWHPDGERLGFVEGSAPATLRVLASDGSVSTLVDSTDVRRFVGWNHDGGRLAYITPEVAAVAGDRWAVLFPRVPDVRDRVILISGDQPERLVHQGVRITFPQWSPTADELSLWGTYMPTHRSQLSNFLPWTLQPGDPAAILNCETGDVTWMAVNAHERAQVGHYHLLKKDYQEAWNWYERAAQDREPPQPFKLNEFAQFLRQVRIHQDPTFFEYYCLTKLNRPQEAAQRLELFRQTMRFDLEDLSGLTNPDDPDAPDVETLRDELTRFAEFAVPLMQSAYATEVFLSLDAAPDGVAFFQREVDNATHDAQRLAALLCLSQLLLVTEDYDEYVALATRRLAPLLMKLHQPVELQLSEANDAAKLRRWIEQLTIQSAGGMALLPMVSGTFLDQFAEPQLEALLQHYQQLESQAANDDQRFVSDLLSLGLLAKLNREEAWQVVRKRVAGHPWFQDEAALKETPEAFLADVELMLQQISNSSR